MKATSFAFDAEEIAAGIATWVCVESPSYGAAAVNHMMDLAADTMRGLGAEVERFPSNDGYGDVVKADFAWCEGPGILVLGHLDTVHLVGTLDEVLPVRRDGDRLYGPGMMDTKGGMYLAVHAV